MAASVKSAIQETKEELENRIFELAAPLLTKLYNTYAKIPEQKDSPDAAVMLLDPPRRFGKKGEPVKIGIEVTSVDPYSYLAYANDKKFGAALVSEQIVRTFEEGLVSDRPTKKIDVSIPRDFIFKGVIGKAAKYEQYKPRSKFDEVILLCFSDVLGARNELFKDGLSTWTNYLLSQANFPFERVIFVSPRDHCPTPVQIYDKKMKKAKPPTPYKYPDATITCIQSQPLHTDTAYNLTEKFSGAPLISPRSK